MRRISSSLGEEFLADGVVDPSDRFLACNRERAKGIRESETLIKTELENVEKEIFKLTWADVSVSRGDVKRQQLNGMDWNLAGTGQRGRDKESPYR